MRSSINFKNILVVGVGLIGGSIIRALKEKSFSGGVYGIDSDKRAVSSAYDLGFIQNKDRNIPKDLDDLLVIFSVPVLSIQEAMSQMNVMINTKNIIYTDTLSVKSSILNSLKALDKNVLKRFVLSHPIAGSEQSGFKASSATLFKEKLSIICPHDDNSEQDISKVEDFWKALGSYTKKLSAHAHDELFGKTSHMPHVIAYAIMDSLYQDLGEKTFLYSGGSLEDYTRIASSDPIMWKDIMVSNDKSILSSIESFKRSLDELSELIRINNTTGLIEFFSTVKNARDKSISEKED
jgi:prephenate dehydrogenase